MPAFLPGLKGREPQPPPLLLLPAGPNVTRWWQLGSVPGAADGEQGTVVAPLILEFYKNKKQTCLVWVSVTGSQGRGVAGRGVKSDSLGSTPGPPLPIGVNLGQSPTISVSQAPPLKHVINSHPNGMRLGLVKATGSR